MEAYQENITGVLVKFSAGKQLVLQTGKTYSTKRLFNKNFPPHNQTRWEKSALPLMKPLICQVNDFLYFYQLFPNIVQTEIVTQN